MRAGLLLLLVIGVLGPVRPARAQAAAPAQPGIHLDVNLGQATRQQISSALEIVVVLTLLTFLPAMLVSVTSFTRVVIVLSFVRRAMSMQELPPTTVVIGLALFLTGAIMYPVFDQVVDQALGPYQRSEIEIAQAADRASAVLKEFLLAHTRESDIGLFLDLAKAAPPATRNDVPLRVAVPSFMLSELRTAFQMGFVIYLPFLVIDLLVSSMLISMGMMMLPPVMISTPLKILLFVMVDGWQLVIRSLAESFSS
ncbi:MAG: flagellar type III secretion system pore protein FliP [Planctomycetota bacterium]